MKWTHYHQHTLKESPSDAEIESHRLFVRAGLIRKLGPGVFTYGPMLLRSIKKLEKIIREELDQRGCIEILMPMVQPAALWQESGRWGTMGEELLRFKNRNEHEFCLGPTHEEVVTDFVRKDVKSYRDLPVNLYQIQTKYRDEIRPRFGLMRGREFIMKDAYSFDMDEAGALVTYDKMYSAYSAIFRRSGLNYRIVQADSGKIGGNRTHEFQVLADAGEDHLMVCDHCDYAANIEVAEIAERGVDSAALESRLPALAAPERFPTPGLRTIAALAKSLGVEDRDCVKTMFAALVADEPIDGKPVPLQAIAVLLRGDHELNLIKLKKHLGQKNEPRLLTDDEVKQVTGASPGSCGPIGLKIPVYADRSLRGLKSSVVGANTDDVHLRGVELDRDVANISYGDLRLAQAGDACSSCSQGHYQSMRGIEVGHVFYLGTLYTQKLQATYLAADGSSRPIEMGCYGIGVTRTLQAAVEQNRDADGIQWPAAIAPFSVHLAVLDVADTAVTEASEILYKELWAHGLDVFMDDRAERPGVKFKDADLIGLPIRINVGSRGLKESVVEVVTRKSKVSVKVPLEKAVDHVTSLFRELLSVTGSSL